jgi:cold-inducible RNA-binding protein
MNPVNTKLHVGNLALATTEADLQALFSEHGNVAEVNLALDRLSRRSLGFAFVTMATPQGALAAIQALHGKAVGERILAVNEAPLCSRR